MKEEKPTLVDINELKKLDIDKNEPMTINVRGKKINLRKIKIPRKKDVKPEEKKPVEKKPEEKKPDVKKRK